MVWSLKKDLTLDSFDACGDSKVFINGVRTMLLSRPFLLLSWRPLHRHMQAANPAAMQWHRGCNGSNINIHFDLFAQQNSK